MARRGRVMTPREREVLHQALGIPVASQPSRAALRPLVRELREHAARGTNPIIPNVARHYGVREWVARRIFRRLTQRNGRVKGGFLHIRGTETERGIKVALEHPELRRVSNTSFADFFGVSREAVEDVNQWHQARRTSRARPLTYAHFDAVRLDALANRYRGRIASDLARLKKDRRYSDLFAVSELTVAEIADYARGDFVRALDSYRPGKLSLNRYCRLASLRAVQAVLKLARGRFAAFERRRAVARASKQAPASVAAPSKRLTEPELRARIAVVERRRKRSRPEFVARNAEIVVALYFDRATAEGLATRYDVETNVIGHVKRTYFARLGLHDLLRLDARRVGELLGVRQGRCAKEDIPRALEGGGVMEHLAAANRPQIIRFVELVLVDRMGLGAAAAACRAEFRTHVDSEWHSRVLAKAVRAAGLAPP